MIDSKVLAQTLMKLSKSENSEKSITAFFDYLDKKNFTGLLPQVKNHIKRFSKISSNEQTLIISSKHDVSESEIKDIISLAGADENVVVEVVIDETIVGGFSATYQGNIYDGSLRNQITQLKTKLKS